MGLDETKPVFRVSDKASYKPVSSSTVTSKNIEISLEASLDMILSTKRITKALIRLRGCADWSAPVLFATPRRPVFSRRGPNDLGSGAVFENCEHVLLKPACSATGIRALHY